MADKKLLKFELEDGTPFYFEVEPVQRKQSGPELAGKTTDRLIEDAEKSFDDLLGVVGPVTQKIVDRLKTGLTKDASEVEVKFGLKLTASTDLVFATAGGDVNFEVTLKWKNG
jgi:Trypsin-co-occurring domain 1